MIKEPPARAKAPVATELRSKTTPASRLPLLAGVAVSLLALVVYVFTLSPTVNFIDSGELITVGATAGIAHPPGYPLYTLLSIAAAALSFGHAAVGVNMVSALSGAAAVGAFYALMYEVLRYHLGPRPGAGAPSAQTALARRSRSDRREDRARSNGKPANATSEVETTAASLTERVIVGVAAGTALLLGMSFTFWSWSTQAKMYSLHFAFAVGLFTLALRVRRSVRGAGEPGRFWPPRSPRNWPVPARRLALLAFVLGLSLTNHTLTFLLLPSLAVILFWPQRSTSTEPVRTGRQREVRRDAPVWRWLLAFIPWLALAGFVPLLIYLYLPLRAAQNPLLNWGSPSNWGDFWRHVTLWQFRVLIGQQLSGGLPAFVGRTAELTVRQIGPWLSMLAFAPMVAGIVRLARSAPSLLAAMALLVVITLAQTYNFQNPELAAYTEHMFMMSFVWVGVGFYWLVEAFARRPGQQVEQQEGRATPVRGLALLVAVPAAIALLAFAWNVGRAGHTGDYLTDAYIHNQFDNFAPGAVVITNNWFFVSPSYYLQYVQHERPDVAVIDRKLLQYPFYLDYVERQYPEVMATVKDMAGRFGADSRRWVDGEQVDSQTYSQLYFDMVKALITRNMAAGRPVYLQWLDPGQEEDYIAQGLATHPEGLALRVDDKPFTGPPPDPHFDWRGILTDVVPKDELAHRVIDDYPKALDRLATFAQQNNHAAEAARFAGLAKQVREALGLGQ